VGLHTEPIQLGLSADGNITPQRRKKEKEEIAQEQLSLVHETEKKQKNIMEKNYKTEDTVIVVVSGVSSVENQS